jgi:hypothetical protein
MKISVNAPSYKRPDNVDVLRYLPNVKIWVDISEYDKYKTNYPLANIISCPTGVQGNICRIRNYIIDKEQPDNDVVCIIDDDLKYIGYFEKGQTIKIETEEQFIAFIEKYSILASDLGVKLWGINVNPDKQNYREYTPFSFLSYVGSPFGCHLKTDLRYDEKFSLKEDYDFTLQNLNKYRKVLRVNKYFYNVKQCEQVGGCAAYRNIKKELSQIEELQKKWGKHIVKCESLENSRSHKTTKKRKFDINPIIIAPIKGV